MNNAQIKILKDLETSHLSNSELDINILNSLLIEPGHHQHQLIAKILQDAKNPSSIPFVRKALETNFDYLGYTCSEPEVIAKWFSWLLFSIGTEEAINLIEEYTKSPNEGISSEMKYRLAKVRSRNN